MLRFYSAFTANFYVYVKEWSISVCTCVILYIKLNVTGAINKITKGEFLFSFYIFPLLPLTYKNVFLLCVCVFCFYTLKESTGIRGWWIGLNDLNEVGIYKWVSGQNMNYSNWEPDQPDNEDVSDGSNDDCVQHLYRLVEKIICMVWY